jgi:hypothetical protein
VISGSAAGQLGLCEPMAKRFGDGSGSGSAARGGSAGRKGKEPAAQAAAAPEPTAEANVRLRTVPKQVFDTADAIAKTF